MVPAPRCVSFLFIGHLNVCLLAAGLIDPFCLLGVGLWTPEEQRQEQAGSMGPKRCAGCLTPLSVNSSKRSIAEGLTTVTSIFTAVPVCCKGFYQNISTKVCNMACFHMLKCLEMQVSSKQGDCLSSDKGSRDNLCPCNASTGNKLSRSACICGNYLPESHLLHCLLPALW